MEYEPLEYEVLEKRYRALQQAIYEITIDLDPDVWASKRMSVKRKHMIKAINDSIMCIDGLGEIMVDYHAYTTPPNMTWMDALGLTNDEDEQSEKK